MKVEPYLTFDGCCEEAAALYQEVLGAEVLFLMRFKDAPEAPPPDMLPPGFGNKIMHMHMRIGANSIMATDGGGCSDDDKGFHGFSLTVAVDDVAEAERIFKGLSAGGKINMPLTETFFAKAFGMLNDKFGISWMVLVEKPMAPAQR